MRRLLAFLIGLTLSVAGFAAGVNLTVPGEGPYQVWNQQTFPGAPPVDAQLIEKNPTPLTLPKAGYLAVLDTQTGNLAVKPVKGLKGDVALTDADFAYAGEVKVMVTHSGKPVQSASVALTDKSRTQGAVLDPGLAGEITFFAVHLGEAHIKVQYVSNGKQADPMDLVVQLNATRSDKVPVLNAVISDDVATSEPMAPPSAGQGENAPGTSPAPKAPVSAVGIAGRATVILIALAAAAGVIFGLYWLARKDPKAIAEKLASLGVQVPKDPNDPVDPGPVQPAVPIRPDPPQKILLENSDPTPLPAAGPITAPPPAVAVTSGPPSRLAAESGGAISLPDGTTMLGREATLGLPLPDPSTLSRRHAEFVRSGDHLLVRDLGSTNGTFVNGRKIDSDTPLAVGDSVQLGAVRFRVEA